MRTKAATAVVALLAIAATPAAFAKESVTIDPLLLAALKRAPAPAVPVRLAARTVPAMTFAVCQVGQTSTSAKPCTKTPVCAAKRKSTTANPCVTASQDRMRSCQVGASESRIRAANETERKAATVACEEPVNGNLDLSRLKAVEAGALAANG